MNEPPKILPLQNLILVGFMGCGKSSVGHHLHRELKYPHIDTDHLIENRTGTTIPEIFETKGEQHFRDMECQLVAELLHAKPQCHVISTGGGLPLREDNQLSLQKLGFVVWLDAEPDAIYERVCRNSNRPLLQTENPKETVLKLLSERSPVYEKTSHVRIKTDRLNFDEISYGIIESAKVFFSTLKCGDSKP